MKRFLLGITILPFLAFFLMMFTVAFIPREVLIEEPFNKSGLLVWQIWITILFLIHLYRTATKTNDWSIPITPSKSITSTNDIRSDSIPNRMWLNGVCWNWCLPIKSAIVTVTLSIRAKRDLPTYFHTSLSLSTSKDNRRRKQCVGMCHCV